MTLSKRTPELDETDHAILEALQQDARITMRELARQISMSPPATAERVRRLEEAGVITGYRAVISPEKLGLKVHGFIIVDNVPMEKRRQFYAFVDQLPEIISVERLTSGGREAVLRFCCRDMDQLTQLHMKFEGNLPSYTTHLCLSGGPLKQAPLRPAEHED